jgi:hypothetical protein
VEERISTSGMLWPSRECSCVSEMIIILVVTVEVDMLCMKGL